MSFGFSMVERGSLPVFEGLNVETAHRSFGDSKAHLIVLRGAPGSGKSTLASRLANDGATVFSRDAIRDMFSGCSRADRDGVLSEDSENLITKMLEAGVKESLRNGLVVVLDNQNLRKRDFSWAVKFVAEVGGQASVYYVDTPVGVCLANNAKRYRDFGIAVSDFYVSKACDVLASSVRSDSSLGLDFVSEVAVFDPYVSQNPNGKPVAIFDIDGTLADNSLRDAYDESLVLEDAPKRSIVNACRLYRNNGYDVVILSGRRDSCREDTVKWLRVNGVEFSALFMRNAGDSRRDCFVKRDLLRFVERDFGPVEIIFDDRDQVVEMWRKVGLTCAQVDYGDF